MNVSEAIVKNLELIGVEYAFGGSGAGVDDLIFALNNSKSIKSIISRHEQGASFMACGYAMFSDKLGVCFATPGPGAFNLISGLAVAMCDSLPVLAISGYEPKIGVGRGGLGETTGINRTPDSQKVFAATTKRSFIIERTTQTCDVLEDALNIAFEGRPGPVHIHIPYDISHDQVTNYRDIQLNIKPVLPLKKQIYNFAKVLETSINEKKRIVAILGYGCIRSHAEVELLNFLEAFQIPFMTTMDAKGILPENHPLSLGMMGISGDIGAKQALKEADVVIAIGNSFSKWQTWRWAEDVCENKMLMQINIDKVAINRVYPADVAIISDVKPAIVEIMQEMGKKSILIEKAYPVKQKHFDENIQHTGDKIHGGELAKAISKNLPENSIIMGDAGSHMLWLGSFMQLTKGQNYQNPGIFGPMAANVNSAIGVQCANPNRRVVVGCGDMGYQMAGFELMTAIENKIPVIWIIFNNGEFNIIKMLQKRAFNGNEAMNNFTNPDFVAYAKACGALGYRVEKLSDFDMVFKEALASNQPALIDVVVDPDIYPPFNFYNT